MADTPANPPNSPVPANEPPPAADPAVASPGAVEAAGATEEDLPDWEPLSPELLEDEAIRGDFVLRWMVVGLAALFGCAELVDATPLIHLRSGQWMAQRSFWPAERDPFSFAAGDRPWINLSWLFDLVTAGIHAVGGAAGLSLAAGLVAAVTWGLVVQTHRPGIRTWWGAICGTLALVAAYPACDWTPALVTLLGTAGLVALLISVEQTRQVDRLWWGVAGLWLWAQTDPRAWIGLALWGAYLVGLRFSRRTLEDGPGAPLPFRAVAVPFAVAIAVLAVHPFPGQPLVSAWRQYAVEYPAFRFAYQRPLAVDAVWYPLWSSTVWSHLSHRLLAALLLAVCAALALWFNRARASAGHVALFLIANVLGVVTTRELALASIVNAVLATIHAQEWYLARCGQVYSIAWKEVLFSRGGRALTLAGFVVLAWLIISGRVDGPDGRRVGLGLAQSLKVELDSYRGIELVAANDRPFHHSLRQGDLLIAAGRRSFVDRRVGVFRGNGSPDLLTIHEATRSALQRTGTPEEIEAARKIWTETFTRYQVSHLAIRLTQRMDFPHLLSLMSLPDWQLTAFQPTVAVAHWAKSPEVFVADHARATAFNPMKAAFQKPTPLPLAEIYRPVPPPWTQTWFSAPRAQPTGSTRLAEISLQLGLVANRSSLPFRAACFNLAIQQARLGIQEDPQQAVGYRVLGEACAALSRLESAALGQAGPLWTTSLRYFEATSALQQALRLDPRATEPLGTLVDVYQPAGRIDVAHAELKRLLAATTLSAQPTETELRSREALFDLEYRLEGMVQKLRDERDKQLPNMSDRLSLAVGLHRNGGLRMAVDLLQEDAVAVERNPLARQFLTAWLAELGEGEPLDDSASRLEAVAPTSNLPGWRETVGYATLGKGDLPAAIAQFERRSSEADQASLESLLASIGLSRNSPIFLGDYQYPLSHLSAAQQSLERLPAEAAQADLVIGLCAIERGDPVLATTAFKRALSRWPESPFRPLLRLYLFCLTNELPDEEPPADWIPITKDLFATEAMP